MKKSLIFLTVMFCSFMFAQKTGLQHKAKIDSLITNLNEWDTQELDLYERPEAYSKERITSGETNGWIMTHKEHLKEVGAEVIWDPKKKRYILKSK